MKGVLGSILWVAAVLILVAVSAWYLAFDAGNRLPSRITAPLSEPGAIAWTHERDAVIEVASPEDAETALGVAHGLGKPWLMALYRQAAMGRLSEWFGPETAALDSLIHVLGVPVEGHQVPAAARARLEAYASGVRSAQATLDWNLLPAAVERRFTPVPWRPEHSIAVERLMAWLSADIGPERSPEARVVRRARDRLAVLLGLQEMDRSLVWSTQAHGLYGRLVTGDSGVPPLMAVSIRSGGTLVYEGATLPGTPYRICGRAPGAVWCKPLVSSASVAPDTTGAGRLEYFGLALEGGAVRAASRELVGDGVVFEGGVITWSGLTTTSDAAAWMALPHSQPSDFQVASDLGLALSGEGPRPLGVVPLIETGTVVLSGRTAEAEYLALRLDTADDTLSSAERLLADTGSIWADTVGFMTPDPEADSYLRNWDSRFDPSSIAASMFDLSVRVGAEAASDSLRAWFGADQQLWRWERDPALLLRYPAARAAALSKRYAPVPWLRRGHPTAPAWGPSRTWGGSVFQPAAAWEVVLGRPDSQGPLAIRRPFVPYDRFLGRYRASPVRTDLQSFPDMDPVMTTRLRPRR